MKLKRFALATAVATALGMGMAGQASADVYAGSSIAIDQLAINFFDGNNNANNNVAIRNFNFTLQNTAVLNGTGDLKSATCGGTIATNTCSAASPTLNALAANAPGSAFTRTDNQSTGGQFHWFGIGGGNWSNSDSVIYTSELTSAGANPTKTDQISESNISSATSASASSIIQSITGFTFTFTVTGPNPVDMVVNFLADPDMRAQILNELGIASAQANMAVSLRLTKDGTGGLTGINWAPDGTTTNNCITSVGMSCTESADNANLNTTIGVTTNNNFADNSWDPNVLNLLAFGMRATGLSAGDWTLTLRAETSTQLDRTPAVPEPASLALVGLAVLGLGAVSRRRRKA